MFQVKNDTIPQVFKNKFRFISHNYPTSYSKNSYTVPKRNKNYAKYSISYRGPYLWNNLLDNQAKEITSLALFKHKLKNMLFNEENEIRFF